mgnify:CR=1 FL=1
MELVQAESTAKAHAGPVAVTMLERLNARLDKAVREGSLHDNALELIYNGSLN